MVIDTQLIVHLKSEIGKLLFTKNRVKSKIDNNPREVKEHIQGDE